MLLTILKKFISVKANRCVFTHFSNLLSLIQGFPHNFLKTLKTSHLRIQNNNHLKVVNAGIPGRYKENKIKNSCCILFPFVSRLQWSLNRGVTTSLFCARETKSVLPKQFSSTLEQKLNQELGKQQEQVKAEELKSYSSMSVPFCRIVDISGKYVFAVLRMFL